MTFQRTPTHCPELADMTPLDVVLSDVGRRMIGACAWTRWLVTFFGGEQR